VEEIHKKMPHPSKNVIPENRKAKENKNCKES